ncbi:MAG: single-stranded-DNA-specific exonuclease RecJ [bacterium]|nr:single-stranded-DNA-specific exonuclease RecJ [bacterium]
MNWKILNRKAMGQPAPPWAERGEYDNETIVSILLAARGLKTEKQKNEFLTPKLSDLSLENPEKILGIKKSKLIEAVEKIKNAVKNNKKIVVYGDYDADGICGTAILWETLYELGASTEPYIPLRETEGYGLSKIGIDKINQKSKIKNQKSLIITVDHGIGGHSQIDYARSLGIEVIVVDHHEKGKTFPKAAAIVHTTKICAAALAWILSWYLTPEEKRKSLEEKLSLAAIATIADLEPLIGPNRIFAKKGLEELNLTKRVGLLALFNEAGIEKREIDAYSVGFIIAPRLNASGRLEEAIDALRLLCTRDTERANILASKLSCLNRDRQEMTERTVLHAKELVRTSYGLKLPKLLFISHESYHQGIIGLVAGKLVEEFRRPAVVISCGEIFSKASCRSVNGLNIIETIRSCGDLLVSCGGHPMAAGFTVETRHLEVLKTRLHEAAEKQFGKDETEKDLKVDLELPLRALTLELSEKLQKLSPFGLGNPEPVFMVSAVKIVNSRPVGNGDRHLKLTVADETGRTFSAIGFGMGEKSPDLASGVKIDIAYNLTMNEWNGERKVELKMKDVRSTR